MAPKSTVYAFDIELSDNDRCVYQQIKLTVAMHPSETLEYMLTRVIAYCLEYEEGISFSKGLSEPQEPALWAHSLDGQLKLWVEVGIPSAEKIHKASKSAARVAIYGSRDPRILLEQIGNQKIYRAEEIPLHTIPVELLQELAEGVEKRSKMSISVNEGELYIDIAGRNLSGTIRKQFLG